MGLGRSQRPWTPSPIRSPNDCGSPSLDTGYLPEGIRQDLVGKTHDDFLPPEDHPFDDVYAGMTEEERIRHVSYVSANTTLKGLKPTAFMDPVQRERYTEAQAAFAALGYRAEEVEKALNDVPPQDSVEKYIKEALRRIGIRHYAGVKKREKPETLRVRSGSPKPDPR